MQLLSLSVSLSVSMPFSRASLSFSPLEDIEVPSGERPAADQHNPATALPDGQLRDLDGRKPCDEEWR